MAVSNALLGTPGQAQQFPRFTPQQQSALNQILNQALTGLQNNNFDFGPIEQQARTNFSQQTIPSIAERFTALNGQGSSAFKQSLGQAASNLETNLASLKSQYGLQQQGQLQNLLSLGLTPSFENVYLAGQPGLVSTVGAPLAQGAAQGGVMALLKYLLGL